MHEQTRLAFFDELEKIAKGKKQKEPMTPGEMAGTMAAVTGTQMAGNAGAALAGKAMFRGERGANTTHAQAKALRDVLSPTTGSFHSAEGTANSVFVPHGGTLGSAFGKRIGEKLRPVEHNLMGQMVGAPAELVDKAVANPGGGAFTTAKFGPHVAAHEFGHASFHNQGLGKALHRSRLPLMAAGRPASVVMSMQDPDSTASKVSPLVGAASVAPTLIDEGVSSYRGLRAMKQLGYSPQQLSHGRNQLLKAYGTYASKLALPAVGAPLAIRAIRKHVQKGRLAAQAAQPAQEMA